MKHLKSYKIFESVDRKFMNEFLNDFGMFITMNLSQVTKMGIDENATKELTLMSQRLRQPIINGMNYTELTKDVNSIYKNPKMTSALVNQIRQLLIYMEPRIQKFVKECDIKQNWLSKINKFKENYKIIIS